MKKWHREHRRPDSSRLSSPLAVHFFTDGVKLCSTNCLDIMFIEWGGVQTPPPLPPFSLPVMGEQVTLCSWARKSNWKCIWHSDKLNLPHHLLWKKKNLPWTHEQRRVGPHNLCQSSPHLTSCLRECFPDYYEPTWYNILPHFKNSDTEEESTHCTSEI